MLDVGLGCRVAPTLVLPYLSSLYWLDSLLVFWGSCFVLSWSLSCCSSSLVFVLSFNLNPWWLSILLSWCLTETKRQIVKQRQRRRQRTTTNTNSKTKTEVRKSVWRNEEPLGEWTRRMDKENGQERRGSIRHNQKQQNDLITIINSKNKWKLQNKKQVDQILKSSQIYVLNCLNIQIEWHWSSMWHLFVLACVIKVKHTIGGKGLCHFLWYFFFCRSCL